MATLPVDNTLDLQLLAMLNFLAEPVAGDITPATAQIGRIYRNTTTNEIMTCINATTVVKLLKSGAVVDADIAAGAAIANSKLATNPLARANHTGTQLAATISDFMATVFTARLDQMAAPNASVSLNSQKIINQLDGTAAQDSAAWGQVQALIDLRVNGQDWKSSVRVRSTTVAVASPGAVVDGVTMAANDRVLRDAGTADSGIWVWNAAATPMTRPTDADTNAEVTAGMTVPVSEGFSADTIWLLTTNDAIVLGTTALVFTQIGAAGSTYTASNGVVKIGNDFQIENSGVLTIAHGGTGAATPAAARTALGVPRLGFAADVGAITAGGSVDVVHSLGTEDFTTEVFLKATGQKRPFVDVVHKPGSATTTITLSSSVAFAASALRVVVSPVIS